jgi:hypothetical protein
VNTFVVAHVLDEGRQVLQYVDDGFIVGEILSRLGPYAISSRSPTYRPHSNAVASRAEEG